MSTVIDVGGIKVSALNDGEVHLPPMYYPGLDFGRADQVGIAADPSPGNDQGTDRTNPVLTWVFAADRVTGIEPAPSAWELDQSLPVREGAHIDHSGRRRCR